MEEVRFALWLSGGGFQDTKSREGQREHREWRHRGVCSCIGSSGSSDHTGGLEGRLSGREVVDDTGKVGQARL